MNKLIIANIFGFLACVNSFFLYQTKTKHKMLFLQITYSILMILEFLILKAYSALFVCCIALIRAILFYLYDKKKKNVPIKYVISLVIALLISQIYTYKDLFSIIPMIIGITYTLSLQLKNVNKIKMICIILAVLWIIYDFHIKAYISSISASLDIISIIIYFFKQKNNKQ